MRWQASHPTPTETLDQVRLPSDERGRPSNPSAIERSRRTGIVGDTVCIVPMTLRLSNAEADALRRRAEREARSMQDVARQAIREYVENHSRAELLDEELPRYAEALERLGQ